MKLTKTIVEALPIPASGQSLHWDDKLRGFGVRVTPSGTRAYIVQGRVRGTGKTRRETIGAHGVLTCDEARRRAQAKLVGLADGLDPQVEKQRAKSLAATLREVADDYCKNRRTKKGGRLTAATIRDITRHVSTNFGDMADKPIAEITSEMCRDRFETISKRSPAQANQAFRILRALINFSIDDENPRFNPVKTLSKKGLWNESKTKSGFIPMEKIGIVWNMLQIRRNSTELLPIAQTGADITVFIMLTGCRWSEAAKLTWDRVNIDKGSLVYPRPEKSQTDNLPTLRASTRHAGSKAAH